MEWTVIAAQIFLPGGAAFFGIKWALNGVKEDVRQIRKNLENLTADVVELKEAEAFRRGVDAATK